jgi:thioredoxin-like negative regulator of GroEL
VQAASDSNRDTEARTQLVHRETFQLCGLIALAVAAFLVTRVIAMSNREMTLRDAAEWFRRGQLALQSGDVDTAVDSLSRGTVRDRDDKGYVLALARALMLKKDHDGARSILMTLRESEPEDREVNLQLARLAAARQDVTEALRFYHNAIYAPWPNEMVEARRGVRLELARFLLSHRQTGRALSELLALTADMPDEITLHLQVAQLFADAGDEAHALDQFTQALRRDPDNRAAIAGAGLASFQLGDYATARLLLGRIADADDVHAIRTVAELVLSRDPLATRLGSPARRQRLAADVADVRQRLQACIDNGNQRTEAATLLDETAAFDEELTRTSALDQDVVETGVDLIDRVEDEIGQRCGTPTPIDQALAIVGRKHRTDSR